MESDRENDGDMEHAASVANEVEFDEQQPVLRYVFLSSVIEEPRSG
jgi:hypothetical protein